MLAPLRCFSLQPKGFFRRTRGRIPESTLQRDWRCWQIQWIKRRGSLRGRGRVEPWGGRDLQAERALFCEVFSEWVSRGSSGVVFCVFVTFWVSRVSPFCQFFRKIKSFLKKCRPTFFAYSMVFWLDFQGWGPVKCRKKGKKQLLGNHRFLSVDKSGSKVIFIYIF